MLFLGFGVFYEDVLVTPWAPDSGRQSEVAAFTYADTAVLAWVSSDLDHGVSKLDVAVSADGGASFTYILSIQGEAPYCVNVVDPLVFRSASGDWFVGGLAKDAMSTSEGTEIFLLKSPAGSNPLNPGSWQLLGYVDFSSFMKHKDRPILSGKGWNELVLVGVSVLSPQERRLFSLYSPDGGASWQASYGILPKASFPWLAQTGGTVFLSVANLGTGYFEVYKSQNGLDWQLVSRLAPINSSPDCSFLNTADRMVQSSISAFGDNLVVGFQSSPCQVGVAVSHDGGASWEVTSNFGNVTNDQINPMVVAWYKSALLMWKEVSASEALESVLYSLYDGFSWSSAELVPSEYTEACRLYSASHYRGDDYDAIGVDPKTRKAWATWGSYDIDCSDQGAGYWYSYLVFSKGEEIDLKEAQPKKERFQVLSAPGVLLLFLPKPSLFKVYDSSGRLLKSAKAQGKVKMRLKPGVYFVQVGEEVLKGVVR